MSWIELRVCVCVCVVLDELKFNWIETHSCVYIDILFDILLLLFKWYGNLLRLILDDIQIKKKETTFYSSSLTNIEQLIKRCRPQQSKTQCFVFISIIIIIIIIRLYNNQNQGRNLTYLQLTEFIKFINRFGKPLISNNNI